MLVMDRCYFRK